MKNRRSRLLPISLICVAALVVLPVAARRWNRPRTVPVAVCQLGGSPAKMEWAADGGSVVTMTVDRKGGHLRRWAREGAALTLGLTEAEDVSPGARLAVRRIPAGIVNTPKGPEQASRFELVDIVSGAVMQRLAWPPKAGRGSFSELFWITFSPGGTQCVGRGQLVPSVLSGESKQIAVGWDLRTGRCLWVRDGHKWGTRPLPPQPKRGLAQFEPVSSHTVLPQWFTNSPPDKFQAYGYSTFASPDGTLVAEFVPPAQRPDTALEHPHAVQGRGGQLKIWDLRTRAVIVSWPLALPRMAALAFSPDETRVAVGAGMDMATDGGWFLLEVREVRTGRLLWTQDDSTPLSRLAVTSWLKRRTARVPAVRQARHRAEGTHLNALAWSPDGRVLAAGYNGQIKLWAIPADSPQ